MKIKGKNRRITKTIPTQKPRNHAPLERAKKSVLSSPGDTLIAASTGTPSGDVAAYLKPLERIVNGPSVPVLRYLLTLAKKEGSDIVTASREQIAKEIDITTRHVSRALAALAEHGMIERMPDGGNLSRYKVNAVTATPK